MKELPAIKYWYNTWCREIGSCRSYSIFFLTKAERDYNASQVKNPVQLSKWEIKNKNTCKTKYFLSVIPDPDTLTEDEKHPLYPYEHKKFPKRS